MTLMPSLRKIPCTTRENYLPVDCFVLENFGCKSSSQISYSLKRRPEWEATIQSTEHYSTTCAGEFIFGPFHYHVNPEYWTKSLKICWERFFVRGTTYEDMKRMSLDDRQVKWRCSFLEKIELALPYLGSYRVWEYFETLQASIERCGNWVVLLYSL